MRLSFHGAAQGVTGSCHLLQCCGLAILIDCGLYQGSREIDEENAKPFGFDPADIDILLLTHAHLDHCGRLPLLVKRGFRGEVITTAATRDLARIVLLDAARLEEEEAERAARRARRRGQVPPRPLYRVTDALWAMDTFGRVARYDEPLALGQGLEVRFIDAGHILGSASLVIEAEGQRLVFSGDIGNRGRPILNPPHPPPKAHHVVMECTYGDRRHRSVEASVEELYSAVNDTLARGGNVIIPTFALERAQEVLYFLREGAASGKIPRPPLVFLDSPMAISATEVFRRHPECVNPRTLKILEAGIDPFAPPGLRYTREVAESMAINRIQGGAVILAGSGMCTGGRVRHHLRHHLWREECSVVFVGYAARGTLARRIIDGAETVDIFGEPVRVRASIYTINGFSAHADRDELLEWIETAGKPGVFLVHGEPERGMAAMAEALKGRGLEVVTPALHEAVVL